MAGLDSPQSFTMGVQIPLRKPFGGSMQRDEIVTKIVELLDDLEIIKSNRLKAELIIRELTKLGMQYPSMFAGEINLDEEVL